MTEDMLREIEAMRQVAEALASLDEDEVARVLQWAVDKFAVDVALSTFDSESTDMESVEYVDDDEVVVTNYDTFAELFFAANPETDAEKVLVAAYWHQFVLNKPSLKSYFLNKDLKDLGHGVDYINREWEKLKQVKPRLGMQVKKTGTSKQARKIYKLTTAGKKRVEEMLGGN